MVIHVGEETHDKLAVHAIGDSAVSRDGVTKVFDLESTFEARSEEAAKGCDQRGESGENEDMPLNRCHLERFEYRKPDG